MDSQFLCFEDDPAFEISVRAGVKPSERAGRQYLANFFGPKREAGAPIPLIYNGIQTTEPKTLKAEGGVDKILRAAGGVPAKLGIDPTRHAPNNNFQRVEPYEDVPLPTNAIDLGYGLGVMQQIQCRANALATQYLQEIQESPVAEYAVILATVKCVLHADAVEGSEEEAPAGVLDCSTLVAMDPAGRVLLLKQWERAHRMTIGREDISKIGVINRPQAWRARRMQW